MRWARVAGYLFVGLVLHLVLVEAYTRPVLMWHKAVRSDRAFLAAPRDVDLLVVGDSHARTAILGPLLGPRVANISFGGHDQVKTWYRTRTLVEEGDKRVAAILVPLDPVAFSPWRVDVFNPEVVWGRYVDFFELGRVSGSPWRYFGRWLKARVVPYAGEFRTLNQLRRGKFGFGEDLPNGDFSKDHPAKRDAQARRDAKDHLGHDDHAHPLLRWAFFELVKWADERGIQVIAIAYPVTSEYRVHLDQTDAWGQVRTQVVTPFLADPRHVFLDHGRTLEDRPELFSDPHHLNHRGRAVFSRGLRYELTRRGLLPDRAGRSAFPTPADDDEDAP